MNTLLSANIVVTRKPHTCYGCALEYPAGTEMQAIASADRSKIKTNYWCPTCQTYWDRHMNHDDEISLGELRSGDREEWEAIKAELTTA